MPKNELKAIHSFDVDLGEEFCTVRRGYSWADETQVGDELNLVLQNPDDRTQEQVVGKAIITRRIKVEQFNLIEARHIEREHQASSRMYSGLLESMRAAYGKDFRQDEPVTVVFYRVTEFGGHKGFEYGGHSGFDVQGTETGRYPSSPNKANEPKYLSGGRYA